jgi:hypothetical protein
MVTIGTHWATADTGALTVTDQRVVYHGGRKTLEFLFTKLATINVYTDAIDLASPTAKRLPLSGSAIPNSLPASSTPPSTTETPTSR